MNIIQSGYATKPLHMFLFIPHLDSGRTNFSFINQIFILILLFLFSFSIFASNAAVITTPPPGTVALVFDDGPTATFTPQVLAILKQYNIKATFFMVGNNVKDHPEIAKMVLAAGHNIANHTLTHVNLTQVSDTQLNDEIYKTQMIIGRIMGHPPVCFHYPFSQFNSKTQSVIEKNGLVNIPTGVNSYDYYRPGTDVIVNSVLQNVSSGQVITLHDGFDMRQQTIEALPRIIEGIKKKGLSFSQICG